MNHEFLFNSFIFLATACLAVPLASRLRLGSVLGYLAAGVLIGPFGLRLITNAAEVMHFAEFGVVMMLFIIGLELEPATLWKMRKAIVGLGGLQVALTAAAFAGIGVAMGFDWRAALAVGMALSLSSTALVLQMLQEKGLDQTEGGHSAFAVLLFQDVAVIPILIVMPLLAGGAAADARPQGGLAGLPGWAQALVTASVIALVVLAGRYLSRYLFRFVAQAQLREIFTAISLALVVGVTLLMQSIGLSPALGAFIAGLVLASSEYRHSLETDIEPFKGLLLGLFFISVGMGMDFSILGGRAAELAGAVAALLLVKAAILFLLGRVFGLDGPQNTLFAAALAQGGEFAFVLFQFAGSLHVIGGDYPAFLTLAVALSMAATPFVMIAHERFILPRFMSRLPDRDFDAIESEHPVIIAGYGRFGQVIGRFMGSQGIKLTILETDPDQIELLRRFGNKVYFGDASRMDMLKSAGAGTARLLIVAVDDADTALSIVTQARAEFPHLKIFARARNRRHAYELHKAGADYFRREMFDASLIMAQEAMKLFGRRAFDMHYKARNFIRHDEWTLKKSFEFFENQPELISFQRRANNEMATILQTDMQDEDRHLRQNEGWGLPATADDMDQKDPVAQG